MEFKGICIAVEDIEKARKFYEEVFGLKVISDYGINITFNAGFSLQQEFDWLLDIPKERIKSLENNFELYFEEDDFDSFIKNLEKRNDIKLLHATKEAPWGQRSIRFYDLDDHLIEVGENLKSVVKRYQNQGNSLEEVSKLMDITLDEVNAILK
ncbi:MAG: VOC family protein [Erysipelotrichales bacterium]